MASSCGFERRSCSRFACASRLRSWLIRTSILAAQPSPSPPPRLLSPRMRKSFESGSNRTPKQLLLRRARKNLRVFEDGSTALHQPDPRRNRSIQAGVTREGLAQFLSRHGHAYFPVFRDNLDDIIGTLSAERANETVGRAEASLEIMDLLVPPPLSKRRRPRSRRWPKWSAKARRWPS